MPKAIGNNPDFANQPITVKSTGSSPITSVTVVSPDQRQAARILRLVPPDEGFHFYRAENVLAGVSARSLREFLEKLGTVEVASVEYHFYLGDFEKWIDMLGDGYLSRQIGESKGKSPSGEELRSQLIKKVRSRYETLTKASTRST